MKTLQLFKADGTLFFPPHCFIGYLTQSHIQSQSLKFINHNSQSNWLINTFSLKISAFYIIYMLQL